MTKTASSKQFPAFPTCVIEGLVKEFVDIYASIREVPVGLLWLAFQTYLGSAISPYVSLDSDSSEPRLMGLAIGRSARTKKSTANNLARNLFRGLFPDGSGQRIIEGFGSAEGMLKQLEHSEGIPTLLHLDEINVLAQKTSFEGTVGIAAIHKLFEDHSYHHYLANKQRSVELNNAYLSMLGASTLDDFQKTWDAKHSDAGFFSRLLIVAVDAKEERIARPSKPDSKRLDALVSRIQALVTRLKSNPVELKLSPNAEKLWNAFYWTFDEGEEWNRIDVYGSRLMAIQAIVEGADHVTEAIAHKVIEFLKYEVEVRRIVSPVIADNQIAEMEQLIRQKLPPGKTLTRRQLYRDTNANRKGIELFTRAINNLIAEGELNRSGGSHRSESYTRATDTDDDKMSVVIADRGYVITPPDDTSVTVN